jgi:hypothetical protein
MSRVLENFIKEVLKEERKKYHFGGSHPEEDYDTELLDDPSYLEPSVMVPNDIKNKIHTWAKQMGLKTTNSKSG